MIIEESKSLLGHRIQVYEHMTNGVDAILVTCYSCNITQEFGKDEYPKYRLALAAARAWVASHSQEVLDTTKTV